MESYKLVIEYEGTRYRGWQKQKNARTVAGEIELAVQRVMGAKGPSVHELGGAGRTDAGVHALAQVAHLRLETNADARSDPRLEPASLLSALNDELPADIDVIELERAPPRFHARHAAISRSYVYQIARRRSAIAKRFVWWPNHDVDVEAMQRALALSKGRHDFKLFCDRAKDEKSTIVVVERAEMVANGALLLVRFEASHFLWKMVRRLVGALVKVGAGELDVEEFTQLVNARPLSAERGTVAEWTAPAAGLFLERVRYPGDPPLGPLEPAVPVAASRS